MQRFGPVQPGPGSGVSWHPTTPRHAVLRHAAHPCRRTSSGSVPAGADGSSASACRASPNASTKLCTLCCKKSRRGGAIRCSSTDGKRKKMSCSVNSSSRMDSCAILGSVEFWGRSCVPPATRPPRRRAQRASAGGGGRPCAFGGGGGGRDGTISGVHVSKRPSCRSSDKPVPPHVQRGLERDEPNWPHALL